METTWKSVGAIHISVLCNSVSGRFGSPFPLSVLSVSCKLSALFHYEAHGCRTASRVRKKSSIYLNTNIYIISS